MNRTSSVTTFPPRPDRKDEPRTAPSADPAPMADNSLVLIIVCLALFAFAVIGFLTAPEMVPL